jgi:hypothetical protein
MPDDLREEVLQESFAQLLRCDPHRYDPALGSPKAFFGMLVQDAIRAVLAAYTPPGQPTRDRGKPAAVTVTQPGRQMIAVKPEVAVAEDAEDPGALDAYAAIEAQIDASKILTVAPAVTAKALDLIFFQDVPKQAAAAQLGLDRFDLYRQLSAFAEVWRAAA